jgi:two-component system, NarL family, nitrate/nitrite response regulator NarL
MRIHSVFLIDASRLFREGLRRIFADSAFDVVHEAFSVEAALPFIESLQPALVLIDLPEHGDAMGKRISQIRAAAPDVRIVALTDIVRVSRLAEALSAGVDGYLAKNMSAEALSQSLHLVLLGEKVFPTDLAQLLTARQVTARSDDGETARFSGFSDREMQILACLVTGDQNKQIANALKISDGTVKVHLKAILKKLRVQNRTQAAIWAMNHGISRNLAVERTKENACSG